MSCKEVKFRLDKYRVAGETVWSKTVMQNKRDVDYSLTLLAYESKIQSFLGNHNTNILDQFGTFLFRGCFEITFSDYLKS